MHQTKIQHTNGKQEVKEKCTGNPSEVLQLVLSVKCLVGNEVLVYLQAVEGLSQVAYAAPLSRRVFRGVLTPQCPGLDRRPKTRTRVWPGPTHLW